MAVPYENSSSVLDQMTKTQNLLPSSPNVQKTLGQNPITESYLQGLDYNTLGGLADAGSNNLYRYKADQALDPGMDQQQDSFRWDIGNGQARSIRFGPDGKPILGQAYSPNNKQSAIQFGLLAGGMGAYSALSAGAAAGAGGTAADAIGAEAVFSGGAGAAAPTAAGVAGGAAANASGGAATGGFLNSLGSSLTTPAVLGSLLNAGGAYVAGNASMDEYSGDKARQDGYLNQLDQTYSNPEAYLNSPEYLASQNVIHNKLQRSDAAAGNLANDSQRQKLMQDHALASLENYRSGIRSNAQLTNPNISNYTDGVQQYQDILNPVLAEMGRQSIPQNQNNKQAQINVDSNGKLSLGWT